MIAKLGQTKRAVMIGLVSGMILAFIAAYSHMPNPAPAAHSPASVLVATPAPVPSWTYSVAPDAVPAKPRTKTSHVAKSAPAAKPVPAPAVASTAAIVPKPVNVADPAVASKNALDNVPEPAPAAVAKEAVVPAAASTAAIVSKPVNVADPAVASKNALDNVPEPAPVAVAKEAVDTAAATTAADVSRPLAVAAPENIHEDTPVAASNDALVVITDPSPAPAVKTLPTQETSSSQAAPSEELLSPSTSLATGTTAALVLAPFVAPVAIIVGLTVGLLTPSASQLGQMPPAPKKAKTVPHSAPSSGSVY